MRTIFLLAGVTALTAAIPTSAEAQGRGNGRGPSVRAEQQTRVNTNRGRARVDARTQADAQRRMQRDRSRIVVDRNGDGIDDRTQVRFVDRDRNGIDDRMQSGFIDRNRDGIDDRSGNRYGGANCPPGLANRDPACVPPGQARRMFREGQVIPQNYGYYTPYDALLGRVPEAYLSQIPTGQNYIYRDEAIYVVDPRTRVVTDIINLLLR
jgi:hypothetical protein